MLLPLLMNLGMFGPRFSGGGGKRKQKKDDFKRLNDERRADIQRAFNALIGHPEPSVVREVREIVGSSSLEELAPEKVTQLLTLEREIDEEDELLLLLI